jgi:hypothetical protein
MSSRWSADDRLALIDSLQAKKGAESESFFDAHGLGTAYRSAGDTNSKRAKINSALDEARRRGDIDDVLNAANMFLRGPTGSKSRPEMGRLNEGAPSTVTDKRIFLSHAYGDKQLADLLRNTLVLGGVDEDRLFYSSDRSSGIPSGESVGTYLQRSLRESGLVIELLSETFLTRPMCLMELGGAWSLGTPTYPIVVPPLTRDEAIRNVGDVQMGVLGSDAEIGEVFDELHDRLARDVGITTKITKWNRSIAEFRQQLPAKLAAVRTASQSKPARLGSHSGVDVTSASVEDAIAITNVSLVPGRTGTQLHGEATNNDGVEHSATIRATFYGDGGSIVGTAQAVVHQLGPGRTKTFSLRNVPEHDRAKVEVDTLL